MSKQTKIDKKLARKVLAIVDQGLCKGVGKPVAGQMCIEAAVCFAMGLPHGDEPPCVASSVRKLKIQLNDSNWSNNAARAKGMRRLAIIQLGTKDAIDEQAFAKGVAEIAIGKVVPRALRHAAGLHPEQKHKDALEAAAVNCESNAAAAAAAAYAARAAAAAAAAYAAAAAAAAAAYAAAAAAAAAYAAAAAAYAAAAAAAAAAYAAAAADLELSLFAEEVVQLLIKLKAPAAKWLDITEAA